LFGDIKLSTLRIQHIQMPTSTVHHDCLPPELLSWSHPFSK